MTDIRLRAVELTATAKRRPKDDPSAAQEARRHHRRRRVNYWALRVLLIWLFLASLAPLLWILRLSLTVPGNVTEPPLQLLFAPITFHGWTEVLSDQTFLGTVVNSIIISVTTTVLCLIIGTMAAYGFARFKFRGQGAALVIILLVSFFPQVAVIIPLFKQFASWGIINTYPSAIIPDIVFALPTTIFVLTVFLREIPDSLEEAATMDGAGVVTTFLRVMLPLAVPGLVTAAILTFVTAWNDYLFANTFLFTSQTWTATVQIPQFATQYSVDYAAQAAGAIAVTIPLVVLVMIFQRNIVSGLTSGAVKG